MTSDHTPPAVPVLGAPAMRTSTAGLTLSDSVFERLLRERIIVDRKSVV